MKKSDLHGDVVRLGVRARGQQIEDELRVLYRMAPGEFLGDAPPHLLRPELRNGASSWPEVVVTKGKKRGPYTKKSGYVGKKLARRAASAQLLADIEQHGPSTLAQLAQRGFAVDARRGINALARHGFVKRARNGAYTRTAKAFVIDTRKGAGAA
jgi:hypothetical protein